MLEAFHVFLNSACVLLKHIFIKSLMHVIKAFISTYLTLAVIAKPVPSVFSFGCINYEYYYNYYYKYISVIKKAIF